jgi:hypothetical protein
MTPVSTFGVFPPGAYREVRYGLFDPTLDYAGTTWGPDVFEPWALTHRPVLAAIRKAGRPAMASVEFDTEDRPSVRSRVCRAKQSQPVS